MSQLSNALRQLRNRVLASRTCKPSAVYTRQRIASHGRVSERPVVTSLGTELRQAALRVGK